MQRAVFLDRDGVLNRAVMRNGRPHPPASLAEVEILPGTAEALVALKTAGYRLIVVTNQPDVARGTTARETVESINSLLGQRLPVDEFRVCYHDGQQACGCRKPKPGLLVDAIFNSPGGTMPVSTAATRRWISGSHASCNGS